MTALRSFVNKLRLPVALGNNYRRIPGLESSVKVEFDRFGNPSIYACSRIDAFRALGYVTAKARIFQMELLRRAVAGRLSEIMGSSTLDIDIKQRSLGLHKVAKDVVLQLPDDQRQVLEAYTDGVNASIADMIIPPLEYIMLGYSPEKWKVEDCILIGLYIMQEITGVGEEENERMMTIMSRTLPEEIFSFLTPDEDSYSSTLLGGMGAHRPLRAVPVQAFASLRNSIKQAQNKRPLVNVAEKPRGSNGWVVSKLKTTDGRAILANDMHLPLSVPNIWYKAVLHYGNDYIAGLMIPGLPLIIAGSNGYVAWGSTNINGDFLDLVELEINPQSQDQYKTPNGWRKFKVSQEVIKIRRSKDVVIDVRETIWGPISPHLLLEHPVAIRWTALDPDAIDVSWINMDKARTVEDAINIVKKCGGPPLNIMLADSSGHIAWTLCGKIPVRIGFDGSVSQSWANGNIRWEGYIPPDQMPVVIDPPTGFLVTANNRTIGNQYPYVVGHHFANGFRARYISQLLLNFENVNEQDVFAVQLDTTGIFYDFYHSLVLDLLTERVISDNSLLRDVLQEIRAWNGKADLDSRGISILVRFRDMLAADIIGPYLEPCKAVDNTFIFRHNFEDPLQAIISGKYPETLPYPELYRDWNTFLLSTLEKSARQLKETYRIERLDQLTWGVLNITDISHPLSKALPALGKILDMPRRSVPGCVYSVRVADLQHGASMRLVVSPGHEEDGILHMPGGQSGHSLSPNYRDQHNYWLRGWPLPFLPGNIIKRWVFQSI